MKSLLFIAMLLVFDSNAAEVDYLLACAGESNSKIKVIERVAPRYPTSPYKIEHIDGWVKLELKVDSNGKVTEIKIINAAPKRLYDRSAKKALKKWVFSKSTEKKERCGVITMEFKLED